ncbi:MAG: hypothetical protein ACP5JG_15030 [Anaerolineae bacterium]
MFGKSREKYVVLQEHMPVPEQRALERAVVTVLPPVEPSRAFVNQLAYDLVEEAQHQETGRQSLHQASRILGGMGGSLLSIIGGIVIWLLVRNREGGAETPTAPLSGQPVASTSSA